MTKMVSTFEPEKVRIFVIFISSLRVRDECEVIKAIRLSVLILKWHASFLVSKTDTPSIPVFDVGRYVERQSS